MTEHLGEEARSSSTIRRSSSRRIKGALGQAPVHWHRRLDGELPGGRFPILRFRSGPRSHRSRAVFAGGGSKAKTGTNKLEYQGRSEREPSGKLPNGVLGRTLDAGVEAAWVVADSVCGDSRGLRMFPEEWEQTRSQHIEASLKGGFS